MNRKALLVFVLLLMPGAAQAQTYEEGYALYWPGWLAAERFQNEVWENNPNEFELVRHKLIIMQEQGVNVFGFDPWTKSPSLEPESGGGWRCWTWWDENGEEHTDCGWTSGTYRCYTGSQIDDLRSIMDGAVQASFYYGGAAIFASAIGAAPYATVFSAISFGFRVHAYNLQKNIDRMEAARCNP